MGTEILKETYSGGINEISLGSGDNSVTVGGETSYPFYLFEGDMPNKPRIAMEVWDMEPDDWPEAVLCPFKDVLSDPAAWAKKCVDEFGADIIALQLKSTDPNGDNAPKEDAAETVKKVLDAIDVPLIVWGTTNIQKDEEVLKHIAEVCQGKNLILGPVEDKNHKGIGASAMGYGHTLIASSPIDVNLAKQVNILLENLGLPLDRMLIDPTTGGLGYGLEYSYSVMERLRMAAMAQGDDKLQQPIINNLGNEIWKCKEAKETVESAPTLGDPEKRGVLMEALTAVTYLMSGSDILIMRHPEAIRMTKSYIDLAVDGGSAQAVEAITKALSETEVDLAALAPEPDLTIEEVKEAPVKKAAPKKEAKPSAEKKAAAPKKTEKKTEAKVEEKPVEAPKTKDDAKAKAEAEAAAKATAEAEAKAKAEADADAKAIKDAEAKAKAEAEAAEKTKAEAKAKAAADEKEKREIEAAELKANREKEKASKLGKREAISVSTIPVTPAVIQKTQLDKILDDLDWIHRKTPLI
ncbi:MAG: acetyl-CoA decarbonylase/synthase complex subunit delta [Desulfobacterales bacterium]|nr:acetyl-CoA decarbonylase/synthase complex subunit delta [Desulfobacterales bacterium]